MNIIHICDVKTPSNGIFQVLQNLATAQRNNGNQIRVFNVDKYGYSTDIVKIKTHEDIKREILNDRPDIVIFHGIFYWSCILLSYILRKFEIPYFIELHGACSIQNMQKSRIKKIIAKILFLDKVIKKAKTIIYLNNQEYNNSAIKDLNPHSIIVPNGCHIPNDLEIKKSHNKLDILFLGRIDINHKGLDILISAIKKLQEKGLSDKLHFSFYGNGEAKDENWLRQELKSLNSIADFYGPVYGEEKSTAFQNSDIFILTSRYEGFPIAILEALSFGVPCFVTKMTNVAEIIRDNNAGWITNLDINSMADDLIKACKEYSVNDVILKKNAKILASRYSWELIANDSIHLYKKALK